jgi:hypothetical protein
VLEEFAAFAGQVIERYVPEATTPGQESTIFARAG